MLKIDKRIEFLEVKLMRPLLHNASDLQLDL